MNLSEYTVIDINKYSKEELEKSNNLIDKIFLMEKTKNMQEAVKIAKQLKKLAVNLNTAEKKKLSSMIEAILGEKLNKEQVKEVVKELESEDDDMLAVVEMIREENRMIREKGIAIGIKKGKREGMLEGVSRGRKAERKRIVCNMIKKGSNINEIMEIVDLSIEEIEEIKKQIEK